MSFFLRIKERFLMRYFERLWIRQGRLQTATHNCPIIHTPRMMFWLGKAIRPLLLCSRNFDIDMCLSFYIHDNKKERLFGYILTSFRVDPMCQTHYALIAHEEGYWDAILKDVGLLVHHQTRFEELEQKANIFAASKYPRYSSVMYCYLQSVLKLPNVPEHIRAAVQRQFDVFLSVDENSINK